VRVHFTSEDLDCVSGLAVIASFGAHRHWVSKMQALNAWRHLTLSVH
jgi:hypothetical protein